MALQLPATAEDGLARARLPRFLFDYVDGGANDEKALWANVAEWPETTFLQRVPANADRVDTAATMVGQLAAGGERGVTDLLTRWRRELHLAMTLTGAASAAETNPARLDLPAA